MSILRPLPIWLPVPVPEFECQDFMEFWFFVKPGRQKINRIRFTVLVPFYEFWASFSLKRLGERNTTLLYSTLFHQRFPRGFELFLSFLRAHHNRILMLFSSSPPQFSLLLYKLYIPRWLTLECKPVQQSSLKMQCSKILKDWINRHKRISDANVDFHICHAVVIKRATIVEGAENEAILKWEMIFMKH